MAVVINEFEVVPADQRPAQPDAAAADQAAAAPPKDPERELERMMRKRQERAARLVAV